MMAATKKNRIATALASATALIAIMTSPANAAAPVLCSSFVDGVVPAGDHNYNIVIDRDCSISRLANVRGNLMERSKTPWSISVDPEASIDGNIIEKGPGFVIVVVGNGQLFDGVIRESGDGFVWVQVDGVFEGNVREKDAGDLIVQVFGPLPSGGPGVYIGNAAESGDGDAYLRIEEGADYDGNFTEKGPGTCIINPDNPPGQPSGSISCD